MDGEKILEVKIKRTDVYDAVKNLLLNEFKVLPADLVETISRKVDNRITEVLAKKMENWQFQNRLQKAVDDIIAAAKRDAERLVKEAVSQAAKEIVTEKMASQMLTNLFAPKV